MNVFHCKYRLTGKDFCRRFFCYFDIIRRYVNALPVYISIIKRTGLYACKIFFKSNLRKLTAKRRRNMTKAEPF